MTNCTRAGKWIGGCRFEARYDIGRPNGKVQNLRSYDLVEVIEATKPKTYVHDICTTCGKVVERSNNREVA